MGVASLGWACISIDDEEIDSGVRIFPAGLDNFNSAKEKHPNQDRRLARSMRRRIRRKAERKKLIRSILSELGWIPSEPTELKQWEKLDPYDLRHRAIDEKITLPELARIILHINQRRGFLSLRKTEETDGDKETQGMIGEINSLQKAIEESGHQTLGNYLYHLRKDEGGEHGNAEPLRGRHLHRTNMIHFEFDLIWKTQSKHHSELTDALRYGTRGQQDKPTAVTTPVERIKSQTLLEQFGLENLTFFQRRVYWPADSIGKCELETDEPRAPIADRRFQLFRMLQEINNLVLTDRSTPGSPTEIKFSEPQNSELRQTAFDYLNGRRDATLADLKKQLCKKIKTLPAPSQLTFNLEAGGRTKISATPTDYTLRSKAKGFGPSWTKLEEELKNTIIEALTLPAATDDDIRQALTAIPQLSADEIETLLRVSLPTGYGHLSVMALKKLIKPMQEGKVYMAKDLNDSALHAAGYKRRDELEHNTADTLPLFDNVLNPSSSDYDAHQIVINNPVVLRALTELRKVVNALIRKHGKPTRIHLEMARSLKMSPKQRKEHEKRTRGFEKEREAARELLEKQNVIPTRDAIQLVQLWKEQNERCPYSGNSISVTQLLSGTGEIDIDHIYPFSRSADNTLTNKVVCFRSANASKGNQTPYEWLSDTNPEQFENVLQNTKGLSPGKAKRFYSKEIPEGFTERDLRDTAWMAKAARQYLSRLVEKPELIQGTKGAHTALLRDHWQLHRLLRKDGIDLKNRDDHRHHALDAILIALCDQRRIKDLLGLQNYQLTTHAAKQEGKRIYHLRHEGENLSPPWGKVETFREEVACCLNKIWVSHRPKRKISGPLHKETNYGKTSDGKLVIRKAVQGLSKKEIEGIRDPEISRIIKQFIAENGGDPAALKTISDENPLLMPSGTPIKKVRTAIPYAHLTLPPNEKRDFPLHVQSASTHHLAIFSLGDGKSHFEPVTLLEATRRLRAKEPVFQKTYQDMPPHAEYRFHLCSGDSMMAAIDGEDQLFVFNTMATSTGQTWFAYHTDAAQAHKDPETGKSLLRSCMPGSFEKSFPNARKVTVLPDGSVRDVNG